MYFKKNKIELIIILSVQFFLGASLATGPSAMEISASRTHIKVGEPLLISLTYSYQEPRISEVTKKISTLVWLRNFRLRVQDVNDNASQKTFGLMPIRLTLQGTEGLEYKGTFNVFYDDSVGLVFEQPGTYNVQILSPSGKLSSNSIEIVVEPPSEAEEKALSFFAGVEDFAFMMGGIFKSPTTVSHLEQVAEKCGDTMLGKWSAARLGIEEYNEWEDKYRDESKQFIFRYRRGEIKEPLFEKSYVHLIKAMELPDEFPIRQEVLYHLIGVELIKGNNAAVLAYANELSQKYPKGEFGKRISIAKLQDEIARLDSKMAELEQERREEIEELAKWLEELWLSDEELQKTIDPNQWQEFIEELLKGQK
jgi:hypothetical protein